jgi:hypothetical protein
VKREAKRSKVPGTPGTTLPKAKEEEALDPEKYRSIAGKIMYLVTKLMVESCNAARESSKHFQKPVEEHWWKELERFVGYLKVDEENIKIIYQRPRELHLMAMVDLNYATNMDDKRSITGAIFTVGGTITNWISKMKGSKRERHKKD